MEPIGDSDYPALFRAADSSSSEAQQAYTRLVGLNLILIVLGALVTSWAVSSAELRTMLSILGAASLLAGVGTSLLLLQTRSDERWFGGRVVAESVKSIAWRYMTCAEPYLRSALEDEVDSRVAQELQEILWERRPIAAALGGPNSATDQITDRMREVRAGDLGLRKKLYLRDRIRNQRTWYGDKAAANARSSSRWLAAVGVTQLAAAVAAVALIRWPGMTLNFSSVLASVAATLIAWLQARQYQERAHAYGMAAHELGLIEALSRSVSTEEEFGTFVANAEGAISREHRMWIARRDLLSY